MIKKIIDCFLNSYYFNDYKNLDCTSKMKLKRERKYKWD